MVKCLVKLKNCGIGTKIGVVIDIDHLIMIVVRKRQTEKRQNCKNTERKKDKRAKRQKDKNTNKLKDKKTKKPKKKVKNTNKRQKQKFQLCML